MLFAVVLLLLLRLLLLLYILRKQSRHVCGSDELQICFTTSSADTMPVAASVATLLALLLCFHKRTAVSLSTLLLPLLLLLCKQCSHECTTIRCCTITRHLFKGCNTDCLSLCLLLHSLCCTTDA